MKSRHRTADSTISSVADIFSSSDNVSSLEQQLEQPNSSSQSVTQHVNLFAELEQQERKNLAVGNKEYEAEKKKEKDDWESKMGNFRAT
jgi:septal ring factor EnvC (AmiA/AmiB activator)